MYPYFLIYSLVGFFTLLEFYKFNFFINYKNFFKFTLFSILLIFMGFKYYVGGDWGTYSNYFYEVIHEGINYRDLNNDIGYYLINLFLYKLGFNFFAINIFAALISLYGIHLLAKRSSNYFLFFLILTPYFIFIILMGYTRQSISIGLFLISISLLYKKYNLINLLFFSILIFVAFLFHKSSIILLIIPIFNIKINFLSFSILNNIIFLLISIFIFIIFNDRLIHRLEYFFDNNYSSLGGYLRSSIMLSFSIIYLVFFKLFKEKEDNKINLIILIVIIIISSFMIILPSSVIIDRFLLYFYFIIPIFFIQIINHSKNDFIKSIILYSILVLGYLLMFLWFNFAVNSKSWVPYQSYISYYNAK